MATSRMDFSLQARLESRLRLASLTVRDAVLSLVMSKTDTELRLRRRQPRDPRDKPLTAAGERWAGSSVATSQPAGWLN